MWHRVENFITNLRGKNVINIVIINNNCHLLFTFLHQTCTSTMYIFISFNESFELSCNFQRDGWVRFKPIQKSISSTVYMVLNELSHDLLILKRLSLHYKCIVCNPCHSYPSISILNPLWFIIISLVFFYLVFQFKGNFDHGQNNSKHGDWASSNIPYTYMFL